jgi:hypothetical protein
MVLADLKKLKRSTKAVRPTCQRTKLKQPAFRPEADEPLWCAKNDDAMFRCEALRGF